MDAKKFIAIFAVVIMIACPLAVLSADDGEASSANVEETQNATHIELKNLDTTKLIDLFTFPFGNETESNRMFYSPVVNGLMASMIPGFNFSGVYGISITDFDIEGLDITVDYIREVKYGEETHTEIAIDVNVKSFSFTFGSTNSQTYMLMSDAYTELALHNADKSKIADWEPTEKAQTYIDTKVTAVTLLEYETVENAGVSGFVSYIDDLVELKLMGFEDYRTIMNKLGTDGLAAAKTAYNAWADKYRAEGGELLSDLTNARIAQQYNYYVRNIVNGAALEQILAKGDMADGLAAAYKGKTFDGNEVTLTGSGHVKLYASSLMEASLVGSKTYEGSNYDLYSIDRSGVSFSFISSLYDSRFTTGIPGSVGKVLGMILSNFPISELKVNAGLNTDLTANGKTVKIDSEADCDANIVFRFDFEDRNAIFDPNSMKYGMTVHLDKAKMNAEFSSSITVDGKEYRNTTFSLDLSDQLKLLYDGIRTSVWDNFALYDTSEFMYGSWVGFFVNKTEVAKGGFYLHQFSDIAIKYDYFLSLFKSINYGDSNDQSEEETAAEQLINKYGSCSHDIDVTRSSMNSIEESISSSSKDNSMLILGIVIAIIVILAIIALVLKKMDYF